MIAGVSADEWTAIGTLTAAGVTVVLVLVNVLFLREMKDQAKATARQADSGAKAAAAAGDAARTAARALELQLEPLLIPTGSESVYLGEVETFRNGPSEFTTQPIVVGVANVGQGIAVLGPTGGSAVSPEARGGFGVDGPPAVAGHGTALIKLFPSFGFSNEPPVGERIDIAVPYRGVGLTSHELRFSITQVVQGRWIVRMESDVS